MKTIIIFHDYFGNIVDDKKIPAEISVGDKIVYLKKNYHVKHVIIDLDLFAKIGHAFEDSRS